MNNIKLFEGQEVKVKTDKGITLINLVHVAKCCGLVDASKGTQKIMWSRLKSKLKNNIQEDSDKVVAKEIKYIFDEIENTDDRNSIYMSSWLSKRLALECHSERANRFKNFLVTLDEEREKGNLVNIEQIEQIAYLAENIQMIGQVVQGLQSFTLGLKEYVQDSIQAKDNQIDKAMGLIGIRNKNVRRLSEKLKESLCKKYGRFLNASSIEYQNAKLKIFKEFKVDKWEDISVTQYNAVQAFIEEIF